MREIQIEWKRWLARNDKAIYAGVSVKGRGIAEYDKQNALARRN